MTGEVAFGTGIVGEILPALPLDRPPAIICIGLNYKKHAAECGMPEPTRPVVFFKNPASIIGDGGNIVVPKCAQDPLEVDYEIELGIVIGKNCKNVSPTEAPKYILGYVTANDVSARAWQIERGGSQVQRCKDFFYFLIFRFPFTLNIAFPFLFFFLSGPAPKASILFALWDPYWVLLLHLTHRICGCGPR